MFKYKHITHMNHANKRTAKLAVICSALVLCLSSQAIAQDKTSPTDGLNLNIPTNGVGFEGLSLDFDTQIDLPPESIGSTLFKLDLSDTECLTGGKNCLRRSSDRLDLGYQKAFTSIRAKGLDLSLTPRAALRFNDESSSATFGAVVEIGEDLSTGSGIENNTWYFFAGADAEALTFNPNSIGRQTGGQFHLQDNIIVGDAKAGLGYRIGDADVSLSYQRREATAEDYSFKEDAAALSFTWKR